MYLDKLLELITIIAWLFSSLVIAIFFWRDFKIEGFKAAFANLISFRMFVIFSVLVSLSALSASLVFIQPQEVGVVISIISPNGIRPAPLNSGLRWVIPLAEEVTKYPTYWQTYTMSSEPTDGQVLGDDAIRARTKDGQEVILNCSIIFRLDTQQVVRIHTEWQNRYNNDFVRPRVRGIVRSTVARFTVNEVNSIQRTTLENDLDKELHTILGDKGFILDKFVLRNIAFSVEYAKSVEQKQVEHQGQTRTIYEAEQMRRLAMGRANAITIEAKANSVALQFINEEITKNPNLLTYEYIKKLSPNIRVMLLPNNTPLLLPLPTEGLLDPTGFITETSVFTDVITSTITPP